MQKIIWNITKKCGFNCDICATQSNERKELDYDKKSQVLLSICSIKSEIEELDFAGGDPLFDKDSREIIKRAITYLGRQNVSVTTTGIGIKQLEENEKKNYLYKCELTIDDIDCDINIRKEKTYSIENLKAILENKRYIQKLTINIPIFKTSMSINYMKNLIDAINGINIEDITVNILRYMPVGKAELCDYPTTYSPKKYIDYILKNIRKNIEVNVHCAMRGLLGINNNCNMFVKKIGIDCEGNVFMCAWAGYLQMDKEKNPFFLGSVLKQDLARILQNEKIKEFESILENNKKHCCIFSYLNSCTPDMFSMKDPLFMEEAND